MVPANQRAEKTSKNRKTYQMSGLGPGKGDKQRPTLVSVEEVDENWARALPNKGLNVCECGKKFSHLRQGKWYCKDGHVETK
jgi:hypothetical protein